MLRVLLNVAALLLPGCLGFVVNNGTNCYLYPESLTHFGQPVDDSDSIIKAFDLCGINGTVIFTNHKFHVDQNTTNLLNVYVELYGDIVFSTNVPYWLSHSYNVGLQNQSTAWIFGGQNVTIQGKGGSLNGNGQTWYTENRNNSNQPGRPITITFYNSTDLHVDGLNIIQQQFWASFVTYSENVRLTNWYINATSNDNYSTVNTDGTDTWNSKNIYISNWTVTTGDDCVAAKGNTTNLHVSNVTCHGGGGMTIGSVGQYPLHPDYDENILFENVTIIDAGNAAYVKTWQGASSAESSNGDAGGGGSGFVRNITFRNFQISNAALPIQITQCIYTEHSAGNTCDSSKMQVSNITWENFKGTSRYNIAASLHCASSHPCPGIFFKNVDIESVNATKGLPLFNTTLQHEVYQCANIINQNTTSGIPCNHWAPGNYGQGPDENVQ